MEKGSMLDLRNLLLQAKDKRAKLKKELETSFNEEKHRELNLLNYKIEVLENRISGEFHKHGILHHNEVRIPPKQR